MATKIEFTTRYTNLDTEGSGFAELEQVAEDMIALAHTLGDEAFHFVNGAVFMMRRIGGVWGAQRAALEALYEHQGLCAVEQDHV